MWSDTCLLAWVHSQTWLTVDDAARSFSTAYLVMSLTHLSLFAVQHPALINLQHWVKLLWLQAYRSDHEDLLRANCMSHRIDPVPHKTLKWISWKCTRFFPNKCNICDLNLLHSMWLDWNDWLSILLLPCYFVPHMRYICLEQPSLPPTFLDLWHSWPHQNHFGLSPLG